MLALAPGDVDVLTTLSRALFQLHEHEKAAEVLRSHVDSALKQVRAADTVAASPTRTPTPLPKSLTSQTLRPPSWHPRAPRRSRRRSQRLAS